VAETDFLFIIDLLAFILYVESDIIIKFKVLLDQHFDFIVVNMYLEILAKNIIFIDIVEGLNY
jgi:hypothetical protein